MAPFKHVIMARPLFGSKPFLFDVNWSTAALIAESLQNLLKSSRLMAIIDWLNKCSRVIL